ncbi:LAMI_0G04808g1_1 [Lachancea mirantina]|uniref:LAMI_0G04808g1_1 n=1 Tax=Lachancea mirantina TaxID=1230905 RepID=A0A1G4K8M3_9SACH|nr:LAMI_0G04808g1_1 [Lachancea mirantina]
MFVLVEQIKAQPYISNETSNSRIGSSLIRLKSQSLFAFVALTSAQIEHTTMGGRQGQNLFTEAAIRAPKLPQNEFPVDSTKGDSTVTERAKTPPQICTSHFSGPEIQMLPTPIVYTPCSPQIASPQDPNLPQVRDTPSAGKKRYHGLTPAPITLKEDLGISNAAGVKVKPRMVSDFAPQSALSPSTLSTLSQRVTSLSAVDERLEPVSETSSTDQATIAQVIIDSRDQGIQQITAFPLSDLKRALCLRETRQIGSGNFSDVFLFELVDQSSPEFNQVAVKRVKYPETLTTSTSPKSPKFRDMLSRVESSLKRELEVLSQISHPCIVKLMAINDKEFLINERPLSSRNLANGLPPCDMIMSYCAGGDLFEVAAHSELPQWLIQRVFSELVLAVKYLHQNNIVHRDIKLENVLLRFPIDHILTMGESSDVLCNEHVIELADFGLCRRMDPGEMCTTRCGSEDYVSPEILMGVPYDGKLSDSWALGVVLFALLEDRLPFDPLPTSARSSRQRRRSTVHRISCYEWQWLKFVDEAHPAKEIVANCLQRKTTRWDVMKISETPYVSQEIRRLKFL